MTKLECPQVQIDTWWPFLRSSWFLDKAHIRTCREREFDKSNPFMEFGSNRVIND